MGELTYRDAGVDVERGYEVVRRIRPHAESTRRPGVLGGIGAFGGLFQLDLTKYPQPLLVSGTDGVGTKLKVAFLLGRHDTVGIDLVAMSANDVLCSGAEPLFFLDYFATGALTPAVAEQVIAGIAAGCRLAGCALIGGETAELPGFYQSGEYELAGFCLGVVNRDRLIDGRRIAPGDRLVGLGSNGLHSNGYSLARRVLLEGNGPGAAARPAELDRSIGDELLLPTRIYVRTVLDLLKRFDIKGMAHITGGGLVENVPRMLPDECKAVLNWGAWPVPGIFGLLQHLGPIPQAEMEKTFNLGLGLVMAVPAEQAEAVAAAARELGEQAYVVGTVEAGQAGLEVRR